MVTVEHRTSASPQEVWNVLMDHRYYGYWVVGSKKIRDADANWPQVGSRFHHTVGVGPFSVSDHTIIKEARPQEFLRLQAKARPIGTAFVELELHPDNGSGTRIVMREGPADTMTKLAFNPLMVPVIKARNVESTRRLSELAEGRGPSPEEAATPSHS